MRTRPRIVHIIKVKGVSGAENHLLTLLPKLAEWARIHLIMLVEPHNPMTAYTEAFRRLGITVDRIVINHHLDPAMVWKIYYLIRKLRPHIVHTHLLHADLYGSMAAVMAGVGILVSTKHGYDEYATTSPFYKLNALSAKWLSRAITISDALQAKVASAEGIDPAKMVTIHYGLDGKRYAQSKDGDLARSLVDSGEETCLMGTVGRLVPVKGYETLLASLVGIDQDFRLLILGDGPLRPSLEKMAGQLGLSEKVRFLGFVSNVSEVLSGLDLFVLPTLGEGFGLVLLEAMAHRLPVVSTDTMAVPEIVEDHGTGLLVPPQDVGALRAAISSLLASPEVRAEMGKRGWEKLMRDFSVGRMVGGTRELYEGLLEEARRNEGNTL